MIYERTLAVLVLLLLYVAMLFGCATTSQQVPAYPSRGQSPEQVRADKIDCEQQATAETADAGSGAAVGAGLGAVIGGGFGAAFGAILYALVGLNPGEGALAGAALGGLTGAASGAASGGVGANQHRNAAYAACLAARGYVAAP